MRRFIDKTIKERNIKGSDPIILCGDFNVNARDCNVAKKYIDTHGIYRDEDIMEFVKYKKDFNASNGGDFYNEYEYMIDI